MDILALFDPITKHRFFNKFIGVLSLANPIPMIPGVHAMYQAESLEGSSLLMWLTFAVIQAGFALVGAQTRNHGMFWSLLLSMILSLTAVTLICIK